MANQWTIYYTFTWTICLLVTRGRCIVLASRLKPLPVLLNARPRGNKSPGFASVQYVSGIPQALHLIESNWSVMSTFQIAKNKSFKVTLTTIVLLPLQLVYRLVQWVTNWLPNATHLNYWLWTVSCTFRALLLPQNEIKENKDKLKILCDKMKHDLVRTKEHNRDNAVKLGTKIGSNTFTGNIYGKREMTRTTNLDCVDIRPVVTCHVTNE